jgi:hypothetical protein
METVEVTLKLPKEFVEDATDFGMLEEQEIVKILRAELDRRVMAFVDAEVKAHRAEHKDNNRP